ncbi:MAG: DNA-binding protein WhiA [Clostridia bacterium]
MSFSSDLKNELLELKMWDSNSSLKQDEQLARLCIREDFIKSGFINSPDKEDHLEILYKTKKKAEEMKNLLEKCGIANIGITKKGRGTIVYIKDGENISQFLALIGANNAMLRFEETRVIKETRNNINRIVNCETANLNKTIDASVEQIKNIKLLKQKHKFHTLPENLQEIAELRIKNPDASYEELGKMLAKPIGKSGVSHRLNRINQIASES